MNEKKRGTVFNLTLAAMFMAIGLVLPFLTGQIQQFGNMLLPMHIPILLCGLICGWQYGLTVGFILPLLRYMLFGMPVPFPTGIAMAFELATYGAVIGLLYSHSRWQCVVSLYRSMIFAMMAGRVVWGFVQILLLILIPAVMVALNRTGLVRFVRKEALLQKAGR